MLRMRRGQAWCRGYQAKTVKLINLALVALGVILLSDLSHCPLCKFSSNGLIAARLHVKKNEQTPILDPALHFGTKRPKYPILPRLAELWPNLRDKIKLYRPSWPFS